MRFDAPPPEPLASAPGFLLSWNGQRMAHEFAAALEPLGLRPPHFGVMTLIVAVVDELEQMGLAERRRHAQDRRKHAVYLTARGRRTRQRAQAVAVQMAQRVFAPLDGAELETLRRLLRKLAGVES
jgi:hypothetical protein